MLQSRISVTKEKTPNLDKTFNSASSKNQFRLLSNPKLFTESPKKDKYAHVGSNYNMKTITI